LWWPEEGCPWETELAAGGERRRLRSGVRGRERPGWGDAVGDRKLMVLPVWGGRGQRGELHGGPSLAALMEGGGVLARASRSGRPIYRHSG
jgi:hypothetical protein